MDESDRSDPELVRRARAAGPAERAALVRDLVAPAPDAEALTALLDEGDDELRALTLALLDGAAARATVDALARLAAHPAARVRRLAAAKLGESRSPGAAEPLARALADDDASVRAEAGAQLARIPGDAGHAALAAALRHADVAVRRRAAQAALEHGAPRDALALAARDEDATVRAWAERALAQPPAGELAAPRDRTLAGRSGRLWLDDPSMHAAYEAYEFLPGGRGAFELASMGGEDERRPFAYEAAAGSLTVRFDDAGAPTRTRYAIEAGVHADPLRGTRPALVLRFEREPHLAPGDRREPRDYLWMADDA